MTSPAPSSPPARQRSRLGGLLRFWRSAAAAWGAITAIGVIVAFALPAVYESASVIEVRAGLPRVATRAALDQAVRSLASDPAVLTGLARYAEANDESLDQALVRVRSSISVSQRPDGTFRIAFSARRPESARRGCGDLIESITRGLSSPGASQDPEVKRKQAELAQRSQELAVFVATHPEVMGQADAPRPEAAGHHADTHADPHSADASDPTILVLRQEKKRLEVELASRAAPPAPSSVFGPNPYDEPQRGADTASLQRRLGELRLAIFAHQRALAAQGGAPEAGKGPRASTDPALTAEWRQLVQGVIDAQKGVSVVAPPAFETRVVEVPFLPSRPVKPNRALISATGAAIGLWSSLVWVLLRARRRDARKRSPSPGAAQVAPREKTESGRPPGPAPAELGEGPAANAPALPPARTGRTDPPAPAQAPSGAPAGAPMVPSGVLAPEPNAARADRATAENAMTAFAAQGEALRPRPMVDVTGRPRGSTGGAVTQILATAPGASPVPPPPGPTERTEPPRPSSNPPGRRSSNPPRPSANPLRRSSSNPPPPAASDAPPPRISSNPPPPGRSTLRPPPGPVNDPPGRSVAPSAPPREETRRSVPPGAPRRTISPPPLGALGVPAVPAEAGRRDDAPDTRRIGSPEQTSLNAPSMPHASSHASTERLDTTYSIVDKSRRASSRRPEPAAQHRLSDRGTRPLTSDPTGVLKPVAELPRAHPSAAPPSERPRPSVHGGTRPGWAIPSPAPFEARGEVVRAPSAQPPQAPVRDEDIVRPLSVPPSWRPPPPHQPPASDLAQLRDQILAQRNGQCFVVGITSDPEALANKSVLAVRLSMLLAETPARVLIMEANFDFPAVHRVLGVDMPRLAGFSQQIHARIRSGEKPPWKVVRCTASLDVLGEGFMRSPGVSFSREFSEAVSELRRGYDFIIADGPTASAGADCKPLNAFTDGLVVAVQPGGKLADGIERAARWFARKELMAAVFVDVK